ncbi:MAG: DNA gyrase inhibitor YacG [Acidobacteriaceae bacterium]
MAKNKTLRCPTCRKVVTTKEPDFPFCCEHCKTVDLGKWASGVYRISSPVLDPELLEEVEGMRDRSYGDE